MLEILKHAHSGLRWVVLALLIAAIAKAFTGKKAGNVMKSEDKKMPLFALIATHTQVLLGLVMYFLCLIWQVQCIFVCIFCCFPDCSSLFI